MDAHTVQVVSEERAARAALLPLRPQHEMIEHQLALPAKQLSERFLPARRQKHIILVHFHPRQFPPLFGKRVSLPRQRFFFQKKFLTRLNPFRFRHYFRLFHRAWTHDQFSWEVFSLDHSAGVRSARASRLPRHPSNYFFSACCLLNVFVAIFFQRSLFASTAAAPPVETADAISIAV